MRLGTAQFDAHQTVTQAILNFVPKTWKSARTLQLTCQSIWQCFMISHSAGKEEVHHSLVCKDQTPQRRHVKKAHCHALLIQAHQIPSAWNWRPVKSKTNTLRTKTVQSQRWWWLKKKLTLLSTKEINNILFLGLLQELEKKLPWYTPRPQETIYLWWIHMLGLLHALIRMQEWKQGITIHQKMIYNLQSAAWTKNFKRRKTVDTES